MAMSFSVRLICYRGVTGVIGEGGGGMILKQLAERELDGKWAAAPWEGSLHIWVPTTVGSWILLDSTLVFSLPNLFKKFLLHAHNVGWYMDSLASLLYFLLQTSISCYPVEILLAVWPWIPLQTSLSPLVKWEIVVLSTTDSSHIRKCMQTTQHSPGLVHDRHSLHINHYQWA